MNVLLFLLLGLIFPVLAEAACSGTGTTTISCPAGETAANINSAISGAPTNATITLAAGTYSASQINLSNVSGTNNLTIICATSPNTVGAAESGGCNMTAASPFYANHSGVKTGIIRVSGFNFTSTTGVTLNFGFSSGDPSFSQIRIDHNTFNTSDNGIYFGHSNTTSPSSFGVIDHNQFQGSTVSHLINMSGNDADGHFQGTATNMFIEDNDFNYTSGGTGNVSVEAFPGGMLVMRFNTFHNARISTHGIDHNGPQNFEVYGNAFSNSGDAYRSVHDQGMGEMMIFDNTFSGTDSTAGDEFIGVLHYRSASGTGSSLGWCDGTRAEDGNRTPLASYRGYPCYYQPGRDGNDVLRPVYFWKNRHLTDATYYNMPIGWGTATGTSYLSLHMVENRDWYTAVSKDAQTSASAPFNGTVGVGFGSISNRPTTCTATSESADAGHGGVGYAANNGTWKTATPVRGVTDMEAWQLYTCTSTNTWTLEYTPYTYPHPLVGGGSVTTTATNGVVKSSGVVRFH